MKITNQKIKIRNIESSDKDYMLTHESCIILSHIVKKDIELGGNG